jgi:polysaccharide export outer membrane protein
MLESKTIRVWFCATLLMCAICCGGVSKAQEKPPDVPLADGGPADYHIARGDVLRIDVWKEPEISRTIPVRPDGKISLPLLNDVQASGLTAMQLAGAIQQGLTKYITSPQVTVKVTETAGDSKFPTLSPPHPHKVTPPVSPDLKQKCCVA